MTFILYKKKTPGTSELELESAAVGSELDTLFPFRASPGYPTLILLFR